MILLARNRAPQENQALVIRLVVFLDHAGLEPGCNIEALLHWTRLKTHQDPYFSSQHVYYVVFIFISHP